MSKSRVELDEPRLAAWLRPLVYLSAAFVFALPLSEPPVAISIAAGAGAGALLGRSVAASRLRIVPIVLLGLLAWGLTAGLRSLLLSSSTLAAALGPASALRLGNALGLGLAAVGLGALLRAVALRVRVARALEVACVGFAFAELVISHRGGAINRPFQLADSIIAQGGDPSIALLAVGALAAATSVLLLLAERSLWRSGLHLLLAGLLLSLVLGTTQMLGLPKVPASADGLGLRPGDGEKKQQKGKSQGGRGADDRNEQLEFLDQYNTDGRQIPLAVVLLHDDYSPPDDVYYFRQAAFSQYNGKRLVAATREGIDRDVVPSFVFTPTTLPPVPNEHGDRTRLETTVAMLAEHTRPFALESPVELRPADNPDPGRFRRAYRVTSEALSASFESLIGRAVGDPLWGDEELAHYLAAPDDPRYVELAEQIASDLPPGLRGDKVAEALKISIWLGREGIYSLNSGHASATDPTASFLFGDRTGYCVHFAHAATYLMRTLGIPARVGAGYMIEESARHGGSAMLLSGSNSHAWPEIYVAGVGWVVADVFPQRTLDPPPRPPDPDLQRLLGEMARGEKPLPQGEEKLLEPVIALARDLRTQILRTLMVLVPSLLLFGYGVKAWRRAVPALARASSMPRVAYRAQLDRLGELSLSRRFGESREAFAARVAAQAPSFVALTHAHVGARFAREPTMAAPVRDLARAVRRELAQRSPVRRRLLGLLHPFSWLRSR